MAERVKRLHDALMRLGETERKALRMYYWDRQSYRQISQVLGTSADAVKTLCWRARKRLKEMLGESFMNSGSR
jgi:RNA polymerase sigma factor (sigma-70 family)